VSELRRRCGGSARRVYVAWVVSRGCTEIRFDAHPGGRRGIAPRPVDVRTGVGCVGRLAVGLPGLATALPGERPGSRFTALAVLLALRLNGRCIAGAVVALSAAWWATGIRRWRRRGSATRGLRLARHAVIGRQAEEPVFVSAGWWSSRSRSSMPTTGAYVACG
jgi:hypothetical protein